MRESKRKKCTERETAREESEADIKNQMKYMESHNKGWAGKQVKNQETGSKGVKEVEKSE